MHARIILSGSMTALRCGVLWCALESTHGLRMPFRAMDVNGLPHPRRWSERSNRASAGILGLSSRRLAS